jgi:DNA-binding protein HU-beta
MNKSELVSAIAEHSGLAKSDAGKALEATLKVITEALKDGDSISLVGFGSFVVRERAERSGRNPQTGKPLTIPASKVPAFKPGAALKDAVK